MQAIASRPRARVPRRPPWARGRAASRGAVAPDIAATKWPPGPLIWIKEATPRRHNGGACCGASIDASSEGTINGANHQPQSKRSYFVGVAAPCRALAGAVLLLPPGGCAARGGVRWRRGPAVSAACRARIRWPARGQQRQEDLFHQGDVPTISRLPGGSRGVPERAREVRDREHDGREAGRREVARRVLPGRRRVLARAARRYPREAADAARIPDRLTRPARRRHRYLRCHARARPGGDRTLRVERGPRVRAGQGYVARLHQAPRPRGAQVAHRQLRIAGVAGRARALLTTGTPNKKSKSGRRPWI